MIPQTTIDKIKDSTRIEEIIEQFVVLKRETSGKLKGLCPFHTEKTPSFNVFVTDNKFHCFGCAKHGDAVSFLMDHENYTYPEALTFIARYYHIPIEDNYKEYPKPGYSNRALKPEDKDGINIVSRRDKLTDKELRTLGRYVSQEIADIFHCRIIERYERVNLKDGKVHVYESNEKYPIYEFAYSGFSKIYQPMAFDKQYRFMFAGTPPEDFIYGLDIIENLNDNDNEFSEKEWEDFERNKTEDNDFAAPKVRILVKVSGPSDAMAVYSMGYHVYWLNSETKPMTNDQFKKVNKLCMEHYQLMDMDATGLEAVKKFGGYFIDVKNIELPKELTYKRDKRGSKCKDIKDFIQHYGSTIDETSAIFRNLIYDAQPFRFWDKIVERDQHGNLKKVDFNFNLVRLYNFISKIGGFFYSESEFHKGGYCYARIEENKFVTIIEPDRIKSHVKNFLKEFLKTGKFYTGQLSKKADDKTKILNKLFGSKQISIQNLEELDRVQLDFTNYNKQFETLIFKNCALRISRNKIEKINIHDLPNLVLKDLTIGNFIRNVSQLINRNTKLLEEPPVIVDYSHEYIDLQNRISSETDTAKRDKLRKLLNDMPEIDKYTIQIKTDFIFLDFLQDLARLYWSKEEDEKLPLTEKEVKEQNLTLINILFAIGYLATQFKEEDRAWFVLVQDAVITSIGTSSGRSGKSLIAMLMKYYRVYYPVAARKKENVEDKFIYSGFTKLHDVIDYDDLYQHADPDFIYNETTGYRTVESKYIPANRIAFKDSGQVVISFNHVWKDQSPSAKARILPVQVSDYYHEKTEQNSYKRSWKPKMKYGRLIYEDFTPEEWVLCDNLIAYCIQMVKRFHKIEPPLSNLGKRQLQLIMEKGLLQFGVSFQRWADDFFTAGTDDATLNCLLKKETVQDDFNNILERGKISSQSFKQRLIAYCDFKGYAYNPIDLCSNRTEWMAQYAGKPQTHETIGRRRIIQRDRDGHNKEMVYIGTTYIDDELMNNLKTFTQNSNGEIERALKNDDDLLRMLNIFNNQFNIKINADQLKSGLQIIVDELSIAEQQKLDKDELPF